VPPKEELAYTRQPDVTLQKLVFFREVIFSTVICRTDVDIW
jgi:hypothetical protein